jgi:exodeoxyribonuclease VII large subunit
MELGRFLSTRAGGRGFAVAERRVRQMSQRVDDLSFRLAHFGRSGAFLLSMGHRVEGADRLLRSTIRRGVAEAGERSRALGKRLDALSPLAVLDRGYSVARRTDGSVVRSSADVSVGDVLEILLSGGRLDVAVRGMSDRAHGSRAEEGNDD